MIGRAELMKWAVDHFTRDSTNSVSLPEIPRQHFGQIAKDVHEATQLLGGVARNVRNGLTDSILVNLMSLDDDSQEGGEGTGTEKDEKEKKDKILSNVHLSLSLVVPE
jgi:hypothetical protein